MSLVFCTAIPVVVFIMLIQIFKHTCTRASGNPGRSFSLLPLALLAACGQGGNPQITMCHSVVEKALGKVEWGETSVSETNIAKVVSADYKIDDESGTIDCTYGWQRLNSDSGKWATAPTSVSINGEKMSLKELASASLSATGDAVKDAAKETAKETRRVAEDAAERATELAEQAGDKLAPAAERASEVAGEAAKEAVKKLQNVINK